MRRRMRLALFAATAALPLACQDPLPPPIATSLTALAGDGQQAVAGTPVVEVPAVRVDDQNGRPLPGVEVTFTVASGEGAVNGAVATTGANGIARAVNWILGPAVGPNRLLARAGSLDPVTFTASGVTGPAAIVTVVTGDDQSGIAGEPLPVDPVARVTDVNGNPVAGELVTFVVVSGSGTIVGTEVLSGADGSAASGTWTLGPVAGGNRLQAQVGGASPAEFHALGLAGPPAHLTVLTGDGQMATVATAVPDAPATLVVDSHGNGVPGQVVRFYAEAGAGSVGPSASAEWNAQSDDDGIASAGFWVLGTSAGEQSLFAEVEGLGPVEFKATAIAGRAASLAIYSGNGQTGPEGAPLSAPVAARVLDAYDNPAAGLVVSFAAQNGGAASPSTATTDAGGIASTSWILGPGSGEQTLTASLAGLPAITFKAIATGEGGGGGGGGGEGGAYDLELRFSEPVSSSQEAIFEAAAARWRDVIVGDLQQVNLSVPAGACGTGHPAINEVVDDLLIYVTVTPIDGPGKVLGSAGPCYIRSTDGLPVFGVVRLDAQDVANMEANGMLLDVILHEIGHVLGIGSVWGSLLVGGGGDDPYFDGAAAIDAFDDVGGDVYGGAPVPVENTGGGGTRDAHWRETIMTDELMTGWLSGSSRPLSAVTVGSLADIGYLVNIAAADVFTVAGSTAPGVVAKPAIDAIELKELPLPILPRRVPAGG